MIKNRKITTKLCFMLFPLIAIIIFQVFFNSRQQVRIYDKATEIYYNSLYEATSLLLNSDRDFYQANTSEITSRYRWGKSEDEAAALIADYEENVTQTDERFTQAIEIIKKNAAFYNDYSLEKLDNLIGSKSESVGAPNYSMTPRDIDLAFQSDFDSWKGTYNPATNEGNFNNKQELFLTAREHLNSLTDLLARYSDFESIRLKDDIDSNIKFSTIAIGIAFLFAVIIAVLVAIYMRKNIRRITKDMELLANYDLSFTPHKIKSKDELGLLMTAINKMYNSLKEIITDLRASSTDLISSFESMNASTIAVNESLDVINKATSEIASSTTSQASDTDQVSQGMHILNDVMDGCMATSATLTVTSDKIAQVTNTGMDEINNLMKITAQNNTAFENIFEIIEGISQSTNKIGDASRLISQISDQTNLLSLNASIEAARAGAAGAGFAIVATEIRQLAEQAGDSVKIIDEMLSDLQLNTERATKQSSIVKSGVKVQNESVNDTKDMYVEIVDNMKSVNAEIASLEQISGTLGDNFTNISELLIDLSAISEETAVTTKELSDTTVSITDSMEHIKKGSTAVDQCAKTLGRLMSGFKLE
jgi:methyl-accepting chemotaxis protein